jgi:hypothetical protein
MARELWTQRFIVDLPSATARRAMAFLSGSGGAYRDISELVAVAVENQLRIELDEDDTAQAQAPKPDETPARQQNAAITGAQAKPRRSSAKSGGRGAKQGPARSPMADGMASVAFMDAADIERLLDLPDTASLGPGSEPMGSRASLSPFTNRLNPIVVPVRVLANMVGSEGAPTVEEFTRVAPVVAREIGMRLRSEDDEQRRRGRAKRATGWPVGEDAVTSIARFRKSFLLIVEAGVPVGPLVDLGLVAVNDGRVHLTHAGIELAGEKTPVLGEGGDGLLSARQQELLQEGLSRMSGERQELALFFQSVRLGRGVQNDVDRMILEAHDGWTEAQVVSHRAALVGRLRDLGLVEVSNPVPGEDIEISINPTATELERELGVEA